MIKRYHFKTIDSTNTWAKEHPEAFSTDEVTLITADEQTSGRGRFKRRWISPPGQNIYATFCFFADPERPDLGNIPQLMALAIADALRCLNIDSKIKWPNDLLLSNKKVGGILCETTTRDDRLCIILGIGLNVNMRKELLDKIDQPATSLAVETQKIIKREEVLELIEKHFLKKLEIFFEKGFSPFLQHYRELLWIPKDKVIRFHDNQNLWTGTFHGIESDGALCIRLNNGELKRFIAGELDMT